MTIFTKPKIFNFLTVVFGFILSLLNIFHYAAEPRLGADIVSRVLPAIGYRMDLGVPYKNYWEITPPGHYIILDFWSQFFGFSGLSIKVLHLLVCIMIVLLVFAAYSKLFKGFYLYFACAATYFFLFSIRLANFILPSELLGLMVSLIGLNILFYFNNYKKALFYSGLTFFFAGQVKDPFLFSIVAIFPYIISKSLKNFSKIYSGLFYSFLGVLTSLSVNILYLKMVGSLTDYLSVLKYKADAFEVFDTSWLLEHYLLHINFAKNVFMYFGYSIVLPVITYLLVKTIIKIRHRTLKIKTDKNGEVLSAVLSLKISNFKTLIGGFYAIGLSVGFVIQRSLGSHYYIVFVVPLILYLTMFYYAIHNSLGKTSWQKLSRILIFTIFLISIFPKKAYFTDYNFGAIPNLRFAPKIMIWVNSHVETAIITKLKTQTKKNECIVDIYGWGVGTTYLYAERKPCSRFFIVNLVVRDWQILEYKKSIANGMPAAIIYNPRAGDLDSNRFENTVINYPKILKNCYNQDKEEQTLYWPRFSGDKLKNCINDNSNS